MKVCYIKHLHETKTADGLNENANSLSDSSFLDAVNTSISILCFVYVYILKCKNAHVNITFEYLKNTNEIKVACVFVYV